MLGPTREVFTPEQAAAYLQVNRDTIYRYIRSGKLMASKLDGAYRVPKRSLDLLLWDKRTLEGVSLRDFSSEEMMGFMEVDQLDEETQEIVTRFRSAQGW